MFPITLKESGLMTTKSATDDIAHDISVTAGNDDINSYRNITEASLSLSQGTYRGTVERADLDPSSEVERYRSVTEAALGLSQGTYTGTVERADIGAEEE